MTTPAGQGSRKRQVRTATVVSKEWLTPDLIRVVLGGADVASLPELIFTDHYVKLLFPPAGADYAWPFDPEQVREERPAEQWPVTRTYTIRSVDREAGRMTLDFVVHGSSGLAGPWARDVEIGEGVGFFGPGGAWAPDVTADRHILVGDEAALPAIAATIDALPDGARADVFLEVSSKDAQLELGESDTVAVHWIHRGDAAPGAALAAAVRAFEVPVGDVEWFVHGVADLAKDLRRFLYVEAKVPQERVSISGYWRTGMTEDAWQASKRDFVQILEAEEALALG